mmetsp:Transcript_22/g.55  ORF Transcript_22/g.55 Transcript_22/m.55 type:complete len:138 (-) Transcript_22:184-597(-)
MLLVCGPVTKLHFVGPLALLLVGAMAAASKAVFAQVPRWIWFGGLLLLAVGALQMLAFGFMLSQYGWRPEGPTTRTVYACQFCGAQFATYEAAAQHESSCPFGTNVAVPIGGAPTVIGMPLNQSGRTTQQASTTALS